MASGQPASGSGSRYPQLESVLRTEEGFKSSIRYSGGADSALGFVLGIAIVGVVYNLISTFSTIDGASRLNVRDDFWWVFFTVRGEGGDFSLLIWAMVWLPVIAVPVMIILLIVSRMTRGGAIVKVFEKYRQSGFLAELMPTGVPCQLGNSKGTVFLIPAPSTPPDWTPAAIQHIRVRATTDPKSREAKEYVRTLSGTVAGGSGAFAVLANKADPSLPEGIFITGQLNNKQPVRIAVPTGDDFTRIRLWPLQNNVPLA